MFAPSSCWSSTLWSQRPPCICAYQAAPIHSSHCCAQTLLCPLQIPGLLHSIFFQPSSNWAIDSCFVLKVKELSEFPRCSSWKMSQNQKQLIIYMPKESMRKAHTFLYCCLCLASGIAKFMEKLCIWPICTLYFYFECLRKAKALLPDA